MKHGSLFSGIGGFDLAAEWMGWQNIFHCEWNPFGQKVLKHYWPNAISYNDITKTDFTIHRGDIDILTGGFPCQPYSTAGKRKGKEDNRHLWPQMLRTIREVQPTYVVGENVFGLINWNGGMVFNEVQVDLEAEGFEVWAYVLPACAINAPHRRDRVWFVAYSRHNSERKAGSCTNDEGSKFATIHTKGQSRKCKAVFNSGLCDIQGTITDSGSNGHKLWRSGKDRQTEGESISKQEQRKRIWNDDRGNGESCSTWQNFPTQSIICDGDDGLSSRLDGITFPKWRNESIKAGGNAIVPQVAFEIFKAIDQTVQREES